MSTPIVLPKLGFSMNEATLVEWLVPEGTAVQAGQLLYTLESDKSTEEIEAPASGKLRIFKAVGEVYEVGTVLGELE